MTRDIADWPLQEVQLDPEKDAKDTIIKPHSRWWKAELKRDWTLVQGFTAKGAKSQAQAVWLQGMSWALKHYTKLYEKFLAHKSDQCY